MLWLLISFILGIVSHIIYSKIKTSTQVSTDIPQYDHAIIIGGSISGMVTAAYLTKYFSRITIIESDDVLNDELMNFTPEELLNYRCRDKSPSSLGRSGVPQIYQIHLMAAGGQLILRELFPQLEHKLINKYNVRSYSLKNESRLVINDVLLNQNLTEDFKWLGIDRFTLEIEIRKELCLQYGHQIQWICNAKVTQLIVDQSLNTVNGVKYRSKQNIDTPTVDLYADFIIDCSGRNSSSMKWLKDDLNLIIPTEQIHFGCGYTTFIGERMKTGDSLLDSKHIIGCTANSPEKNNGWFIIPIRTIKTTNENSLGTISTIAINSNNSEYPPIDSFANLLEWVKDNLHSDFYTILKSTKVHGPLATYNGPIDYRKYVEVLEKKWPENFVLLGDAMCTVNPQFGQENRYKLNDISHIYNNRASAISEECWLASTASDWKTSTLKVIKTDENGETTTYQRNRIFTATEDHQLKAPFLFKIMQWYTFWFLQCAAKSGEFTTEFQHVMNQCSSPFRLFKPLTILAVFHTALMYYLGFSKKIFFFESDF
ncbi:unnamed protein product [Adineta steineri]|uniref:Uncharacterized protein n=1 Tax=Adineta steineri TaxID=433720 RepID=A0A814X4L2_9BILA|nr:unnamed protein product [Adineta steineri]CAF1210093.1 unnamed protein product [Adineta steineri]